MRHFMGSVWVGGSMMDPFFTRHPSPTIFISTEKKDVAFEN